MAEIPWWAWLAVGLFVTVASAVSLKKPLIFILVGFVFVITGIAKVVMLFVLTPRRLSSHPVGASACPVCRAALQKNAVYCHYCGTKLARSNV